MAKNRVVEFWWDYQRVHVKRADGKERIYKADGRYSRKSSVYNRLPHGNYGNKSSVPVAAEVKLTSNMKEVIVGMATRQYYSMSPFNIRTMLKLIAGGYITVYSAKKHWLTRNVTPGVFGRYSNFKVTDKGRVVMADQIAVVEAVQQAEQSYHARLEALLPQVKASDVWEVSVTENNRFQARVRYSLSVSSSYISVETKLWSVTEAQEFGVLLAEAVDIMQQFINLEGEVYNGG